MLFQFKNFKNQTNVFVSKEEISDFQTSMSSAVYFVNKKSVGSSTHKTIVMMSDHANRVCKFQFQEYFFRFTYTYIFMSFT